MEQLLGFGIFWGIWLLVPLAIDGVTALVYLVGAGVRQFHERRARGELPAEPPLVSVVVPVYNGAATLSDCLDSIRRQRYPARCLEVIVVDNGSTDRTAAVFRAARRKRFGGALHWLSLESRGKARALNAGFYRARGRYLCNVDADVVLHPDAIRNAVAAFEADRRLGALTGAITVLPAGPTAHPARRALADCEFLEYCSAFRVGRQYQSVTNSLFTLAGAFSMFRREVLLQTSLYSTETVSEDTHLTFGIRQRLPAYRLGCSPAVVAYVQPTASLAALYSQRVRWQRGELEVTALHPELFARNPLRPTGLAPARSIAINHTLAFPRVVWTILLPLLPAFGYPLRLVLGAVLATYACYVAVEALWALVSYLLTPREVRRRIRAAWWVVALMPAYRFVLFWFRLGGFISALVAPGAWSTTAPWIELRRGLSATLRSAGHLTWRGERDARRGAPPSRSTATGSRPVRPLRASRLGNHRADALADGPGVGGRPGWRSRRLRRPEAPGPRLPEAPLAGASVPGRLDGTTDWEAIGRSLAEAFAGIPDPRSARGRRHPLAAILALTVAGRLAGARSRSAIARWGRQQPPGVVEALGFTRSSTPAPSTLRRVFRAVDGPSVGPAVRAWAAERQRGGPATRSS